MLTNFLARLLGLWIVIAGMSMVANRPSTVATMSALFADPALMWVTGVFTLGLGLALVIAHNRWSGGPVPIIVTLFGWIAVVKGLLFLWLPPPAQMAFFDALHFGAYFYAYFIISLVLGGYLIYGGFART